MENEVGIRRLGVEHGEGELVVDLLPVELLGVLEQVDKGVEPNRPDPRVRHDRVGIDFAQVAILVGPAFKYKLVF